MSKLSLLSQVGFLTYILESAKDNSLVICFLSTPRIYSLLFSIGDLIVRSKIFNQVILG